MSSPDPVRPMRLVLVQGAPGARSAAAAEVPSAVANPLAPDGWAARLAARGHDVVVVRLGPDATPGSQPPCPTHHVRAGGRPREDAARIAREVRALVERFRPDAVWASVPEAGEIAQVLGPEVGLLATCVLDTGAPDDAIEAAIDGERWALQAKLLTSAHHLVAGSEAVIAALRERGRLGVDRPATVIPLDGPDAATPVSQTVVRRMEEELHLARELARPKHLPRRSRLSGVYRAAWATIGALGARRPRTTRPDAPRRIAILRVGLLGDQLLLDPLLAALREAHPRASLEVVVDDPSNVPTWMLGAPSVEYRALHVRSGKGWARPGSVRLADSLKALEAAWADDSPDMIVFADPIETDSIAYFSAAVAHAAASAWRVGLAAGAVPEGFLDERVEHGPPVEHELTRMAALAHAAGAPTSGPRLPRVPPSGPPEAHERPRIAFHMGASTSVRRWAAERYAQLAERLHADMGAEIVLVGAPSERDEAARVFPEGAAVPVTNLVGGTTVADLPAVLRSCDAFVGNDSFPFHLAVACGLPAVVLIGPGTRRYYDYPLGRVSVVRRPLVCSPHHGEECPYMVTCPHAACMQAIRVDDVSAAVTDVLRLASSRSDTP